MNALRALLAAGLLSSVAAQAAVVVFTGQLAPEAVGATGTGGVTVAYDPMAHSLAIDATFSGLSGNTTVAHIHCCVVAPGTGTVGVAVTPTTLPGFPMGVKASVYHTDIDLTLTSSFTDTFRGSGTAADAEAALFAGLSSGRAYFNIHSNLFPSGEIRAFLNPVPEPGTVALMLAGLGAAAFAARRRRR